MAFDDLITKINMLFVEMENQPKDASELLEQIRLELNQLKATGQPLPDDLVRLEKRLEEEFEAAAKTGKS
jgi:predicted nuclease with TOPRIM domain